MAIRMGDFKIGEKVLVIAEIGSNHIGDMELAHKTIDAAADSGVDAVKFQLFVPELLVTKTAQVYKHVSDNRYSTQRERFKHMALPYEELEGLAKHAEERNLLFLCTPFDINSADFLEPFVPAYKIASGDTTNYPLIDHIAAKKKPIMISTGLCDQDEVDLLVKRLPRDKTILFHCIGAYPTPDRDVNLAMIPFYRHRYNLLIGYSDHTPDLLAAFSAAALGTVAVEKHFILDKTIPAGDRSLSLDPEEMKALVTGLRRIEKMRGSTPRVLQESELYGRRNLRRSPYARRSLQKGEQIAFSDIIFLRPEIEGAIEISEINLNSTMIALSDIAAESPLTWHNARKLK